MYLSDVIPNECEWYTLSDHFDRLTYRKITTSVVYRYTIVFHAEQAVLMCIGSRRPVCSGALGLELVSCIVLSVDPIRL